MIITQHSNTIQVKFFRCASRPFSLNTTAQETVGEGVSVFQDDIECCRGIVRKSGKGGIGVLPWMMPGLTEGMSESTLPWIYALLTSNRESSDKY